MIRPRAHIAAMAPYTLARMEAPQGKPLISLAQNESVRPPAPAVMHAVSEAMAGAANYPDPDWTRLRNTLAAVHGIDPTHILCGAGSLDLIGCLTRVYAGADRAVLAPGHAYPFFRTAAQIAEARFDTAAEDHLTASVDNLLGAVQPDTSLVFIANPGNPTGTRIPTSELRRLRDGLRGDILLVVDEAYGEFADPLGERVFDLVDRGDTIVLRTFSKAYGLAGARVGWGLFPPELAGQVRKVMNPNNLPSTAQAAAEAALQDQPYMRETCALIDATKDRAAQRVRAAGITTQDSFANFLLLDFGSADAAQAADAALQAQGIFLRAQAGAGLPHCLRMTISPADHVDMAVTALDYWMQEVVT